MVTNRGLWLSGYDFDRFPLLTGAVICCTAALDSGLYNGTPVVTIRDKNVHIDFSSAAVLVFVAVILGAERYHVEYSRWERGS
jgi:hypothetical protein